MNEVYARSYVVKRNHVAFVARYFSRVFIITVRTFKSLKKCRPTEVWVTQSSANSEVSYVWAPDIAPNNIVLYRTEPPIRNPFYSNVCKI